MLVEYALIEAGKHRRRESSPIQSNIGIDSLTRKQTGAMITLARFRKQNMEGEARQHLCSAGVKQQQNKNKLTR